MEPLTDLEVARIRLAEHLRNEISWEDFTAWRERRDELRRRVAVLESEEA